MKTIRLPAQDVPLIGSYDIVVLGGGPAGIAAAIAAGRLKARALLVEQTGCLGGMSTCGLVPCLAPLSQSGPPLVGGIMAEVLERMEELGGIGHNDRAMKWIPTDPEKLKLIYDTMIAQARVRPLFFTITGDVIRKGGRVTHILLHNKSGTTAVEGQVFIDATGDGDVIARSGGKFEKGDSRGRMQAASLCYAATGVDLPSLRKFDASLGDTHAKAAWFRSLVDGGALPKIPKTEFRGLSPFEVAPDLVVVNFAHVFGIDGCNADDLTAVMTKGRAMVHAFVEYARKNVPGMAKARVVATAALPGIRETRRIAGHKRITVEDFLGGSHFDDDIAWYDYPVDVHNSSGSVASVRKFMKDFDRMVAGGKGHYGIPLGCLLPKGLDNVIVAGRCLSADRPMHGSARVMTACFAMGQAAGTAAAMASARKICLSDLDVPQLRRKLKAAGAVL